MTRKFYTVGKCFKASEVMPSHSGYVMMDTCNFLSEYGRNDSTCSGAPGDLEPFYNLTELDICGEAMDGNSSLAYCSNAPIDQGFYFFIFF